MEVDEQGTFQMIRLVKTPSKSHSTRGTNFDKAWRPQATSRQNCTGPGYGLEAVVGAMFGRCGMVM